MTLVDGGVIPLTNVISGMTTAELTNAGAPTAGTSEVQTITLSNFGACTLRLGFMGASADVTFTGSEDNTAIDTAVTAALEGMHTIGSGNVSVSVSGTTNRAMAVTFAGNLAKRALPLMTASVIGGATVQATLSTNLTGTNNDLTYTAVDGGTAGNSITIAYVDPSGNDQELGVVVTDTDIVVNLATGGAGAITSTAADIEAAIEADEDAAALVTVANKTGNDGTGVVTALAETALAGGLGAESVAVVETTPGVDATGLGVGIGALLRDTTNGVLYQTTTAGVPTWAKVGTQS